MKMALGILALCLSICAFLSLPASAGTKLLEVGEPEDMIKMSLYYSTGKGDGYTYELWEENGEVLFSANSEGRNGIVFENVPVDPEYMRRLRDLAKRHGFTQMREKDPTKGPFIHDAPMYGLTMYWPGKKQLRLNYWPARDEVDRLFFEITGSLVNKPGAPEDISSLHYNYVATREPERFNFSLRADKEKFLFSAFYYTPEREKVVLRNVTVDSTWMQKLREIVKAHNITAMQGEAFADRMMRRQAFTPPYAELNLAWPDMRLVFLGQPASGSEELKQFFQNLAEANTKHWEPTQDPDKVEWLTFSCTRENESDSFWFHLRFVSASYELMARCFTKDGKKLEYYAPVDPKYMEELLQIVKRHGIVERLKKTPYAERERSVMKDKFPCILLLEWRYDPRLRLTSFPSPGGEELEAFFRNLAQKYAR